MHRSPTAQTICSRERTGAVANANKERCYQGVGDDDEAHGEHQSQSQYDARDEEDDGKEDDGTDRNVRLKNLQKNGDKCAITLVGAE